MRPTRYISLSASIVASVDKKLIAAMESGAARAMTVTDWNRIRREGLKLAKSHAGRKKP